MANTTARIRLALEGQGQVVQGMKQVEDGTASLRRSMASLVGALSVGATVREYFQAADAVTLLQNRLKLATGSAQAAASAYNELFDVAQRSRVSFTSLGTTYATIARSTKELGLSQRQLMTVTEAIGNAMTVSGGSTESMNAALVQLGQGLGSGTLRGEELNSVMEQTPRLAQAIADGLGITLGKLREYAKDGKLTAETVTKALRSQASVLAGEVQNSTLTFGQAMTVARNSATAFVGQIDATSGASGFLAQTVQEASRNLDALTGAFAATRAEASPLASTLGGAFAVAMETVSVLAVNVAYVFRQVGNEIGGMAAQAVAFMSLDFSGAAAIGRMMREDAAKARAEVDATTARILSARNLAAVAATGAGQDEPRFMRLLNPTVAGPSPTPASPSAADAKRLADAAREAEKALTEERRRSADVVALRNKLVGEGFEAEQKNIEAARESNRELVQRYENSAASAAQRLQDLEFEAEAVALSEKYQIGMAQAVELTTIARLKEQQVAAMGNEAIVLQLQKEIEAREKIVGMLDSKAARDAGAELRKNEAAEWAKTWDQVGQSFTDALMQGGKSVKQYLEGLFRTMVLRPLLAPITGGITSMMGGPAAAAQAGGGGGGGGLGMLSSLHSAYTGLSTGFSGIGASVGSIGASMQYGTAAFSQQSTMLAAQEAGMGTMAGTMGSAASMLGGAMVGFMAGKMISGGYSAIGKSGNAAVGAGTALGLVLSGGNPIGAAIGGALGGVVNRLFGRKAPVSTGSGIVGEFSTTGASVQGYNDQFAKGGMFRSNKSWTEYSAVSSDLDTFLDASLVAITGATRDYAALLGLNADAVNGATQSIRVSLKDLNAEQQQAAIMGALSGFGDKLAERLLGTMTTVYEESNSFADRFFGRSNMVARQVWTPGEFVRDGETAGAALNRLGTSLTAVNIVFDTLNTTLMKGSLIGADAASKLLDAFGGADAFTAQTSAYYEAFYTQAERTSTSTRQLTEVLAGLGLALPESRTAFRELVEAQDLYTDAGRSTYAALIGLAPVFDQITQATEQMGKALSDEVLRLRGLLTGSSVNNVGALQADFALATAAARAGDAGALERLPAISQALESAAALQAVTAADLALVRGQLTASLSDTMLALGLDVPQFAVGTNYVPRDMLARIHEGEAIIPKAYNPAAGNGMGNTARLEAQLERMAAELAELKNIMAADVGHNAKTARILERVTPDGTSLSTVAAA